jgi:hypothetical protein
LDIPEVVPVPEKSGKEPAAVRPPPLPTPAEGVRSRAPPRGGGRHHQRGAGRGSSAPLALLQGQQASMPASKGASPSGSGSSDPEGILGESPVERPGESSASKW